MREAARRWGALPLTLLVLLAAAPVEARSPFRRAVELLTGRSAGSGVAVLTGTFDPIHSGHLQVAQTALRELGVARVILVPRPPYGEKDPQPMDVRLEMMRAAVRGLPGLEVADRRTVEQLTRGGDEAMLAGLRQRLGTAPLYRISGTDSFAKALRCGAVARDLEHGIRCAVVPRAGYRLPAQLPAGVAVLHATPQPVSSTEIRAALARGATPTGLPLAVAAYIQRRGIYRGAGN